MKHVVHITVTLSVEIDDTDYHKRMTNNTIIQHAIGKMSLDDRFDLQAVIAESYEEPKRNVKKGIGSY